MSAKEETKTSTSRAILRIEVLRTGRVTEITSFLMATDRLYGNILEYRIRIHTARISQPSIAAQQLKHLFKTSDPSHDKSKGHFALGVHAVMMQSPGFWEFIGTLSPLQFIRDILNDLHERSKDREYKNYHEEQRLRLENEKMTIENDARKAQVERENLRNEKIKLMLLSSDIDLMRKLGLPDEQINSIIGAYITRPASKLLYHQDTDLIGNATMKPEE